MVRGCGFPQNLRITMRIKIVPIILAITCTTISFFILWTNSKTTTPSTIVQKIRTVDLHHVKTVKSDVIKEPANDSNVFHPGISRYGHVAKTVVERIFQDTAQIPVPSKEDIYKFINDPVERFDMKPPKTFLKDWKNPCWFVPTKPINDQTAEDSSLRCLPAFYILGFPKCGTTDIWYRILQHPQVINFTKVESHWWSTTKFYMKRNLSHYAEDYSSAMKNQEKAKRPSLVMGDDSPSYMWMQNFRSIKTIKLRELLKMEFEPPIVMTPHLIREYTPKAKFIVMLRDPIIRLYSHYLDKGFLTANLISRRAMRSLKGFHSQVVQKIALFNDCAKRKPIRTCAHDPFIFRENNEFLVRLERGLYSVYISEWLTLFPREQFFFMRVEDYAKDVPKALKEVFAFLELDKVEESKFRDIVAMEVANQAKSKGDDAIGPMWNMTRDLLEEFYQPFNVALAELMQDKRYLWND